MGRIAEALKKAEQERSRSLCVDEWKSRARLEGVTVPLPRSAQESIRDDRFTLRLGGLTFERGRRHKRAFSAEPPRRTVDHAPAWDAHPTVIAAHDGESRITEQYRAARTWLLRRNTNGKHACVAITSSVPREGKSVTTANLSIVMAEVRHLNVLAIDCDFRRAALARLLNLPNSPGLSDVLAGRATLDQAVATTPRDNLFFLPAGASGDLNPTELLQSRAAARVFDEIRDRFHFALVDTPPVQALSDVGVIGALCSGIVMVVRMNKTGAHIVRQSLHRLHANNLEVLGCLAADCTSKGSRYSYEDDR